MSHQSIAEIVRELRIWAACYAPQPHQSDFTKWADTVERLSAENADLQHDIERHVRKIGLAETCIDGLEERALAAEARLALLSADRDDAVKANGILHGLLDNETELYEKSSAEIAELKRVVTILNDENNELRELPNAEQDVRCK